MDIQLQRSSYQSPLPSKLEFQHPLYREWTAHRSEDERCIPPAPTKKQKLSQSSARDEKALDAPLNRSRKLPPIRAPSLCSVPPPPFSTLPKQCFTRPIGFENLLNPTYEDKVSASGRQHEERDSSRTAPMASTPSLRAIVLKRESLGDVPLPSISPTLMETYPPPLPQPLTRGSSTDHGSGLVTTGLSSATTDRRQAPFVIPRDHASILEGMGPLLPSETAITPSMPSAHTYSPPPRRTSPPSALPRVASTSEPRSSFSTPSTFGEKGFNAPILEASGQSQTMTIELKQGPIQIPIDIQVASKFTDERRKRNATASHNLRQRRKKEEREISDKIADLEAQVQETTKLKEHYQRECDFLWGVVQQHRILISPRPPSPRPRQAVLGSVCEAARVE